MRVQCPSCEARVPAADVDLAGRVAKCRACDEVFPLPDSVRGKKKKHAAPRVTQPDSMSVVRGEPPAPPDGGYRDGAAPPATLGSLVITRRWKTFMGFAILGFAVIWNAFLVYWYQLAVTMDSAPWVTFVAPLLHVAAGIGITYYGVALLVNRTVITLDGGQLGVMHAPLPWPGAKTLPSGEIRQLFVRRDVRSSSSRNGGRQTSITYAVCVDSGVAVDLVKGLPNEGEARFIEQTIEAHLLIEDDPSANQL